MPEPHARAVELTTAMFERDTAVRALGITVDGIAPGRALATGADVEYLAPVLEGDLLVATAQERALRGRSGIYDVTVRRGDEPVLEFRGRSRTVGAVRPSAQG